MDYSINFPNLGIHLEHVGKNIMVGNFSLAYYGMVIAVGMMLGMKACTMRAKETGQSEDDYVDMVIVGLICGVIGARIYYVIFAWDYYKDDILSVFNIRQGGLAIYGGIIGAIAVGLIICRVRKVKILPMLDITVLGFLIGQGIGRWGNFVNQEAFGENTSNFLGMTGGKIQDTIYTNATFIDGKLSDGSVDYLQTVHPCFFYESMWCLLGFFLLSWYSKRRKYDGQILLLYMSW